MKLTRKCSSVVIYTCADASYEVVPIYHHSNFTAYELYLQQNSDMKILVLLNDDPQFYAHSYVEYEEIEILDSISLAALECYPVWVQHCVLHHFGFDTDINGELINPALFGKLEFCEHDMFYEVKNNG